MYYEATNYLAELIKSKGTKPLVKVDMTGAFYAHEDLEPEEIALSIGALFDALEIVGAKDIALGENEINQASADSISGSF